MNREERKEYMKAWYQAHREEMRAYQKSYNRAHKEDKKAWYQAHREEKKAYVKAWSQEHKDEMMAYQKSYNKSDINSEGITKNCIRNKSSYYLFKTLRHAKVEGYEIHHCFGYEDYKNFIYIPKELHLQIHQYLRDNGIDADSDHYSKIEHLIVNYIKFKERHILVLRR